MINEEIDSSGFWVGAIPTISREASSSPPGLLTSDWGPVWVVIQLKLT